MKAVYIEEHGSVDVLKYGDLPDPDFGPNDVKVRVRACALNRKDIYTRAGIRGMRLPLTEPHVLGGDKRHVVIQVLCNHNAAGMARTRTYLSV